MIAVQISGIDELSKALDKYQNPILNRALQKGTDASAKFLKPRVQAEAPRRTGKLRKSVSARKAKRNRPASIVTVRAWYRHFVIRGTKPHRIRFHDQVVAGVPKTHGNIEHPGARSNPFIDRAAERYDDQAIALGVKAIEKEIA